VLGNGAFKRSQAGEVSTRDKLRSVVRLLRAYVLTFDRARRRLFFSLVGLGIRERVSMDVVVKFLLMVSSFRGYLAYTRTHQEETLAKITAADKGAWCDDPRSKDPTQPPAAVASLYHGGARSPQAPS
jgi:hypothetical protein